MIKLNKKPSLMEIEEKESDFFNKIFMMSYSGLSKLIYSPALFYNHYVLKQREDTINDRSMIDGKLIHTLLFQKENFEKEYIISPNKLPGNSTLQLVNHIYEHYKMEEESPEKRVNLAEYGEEILEYLKNVNLYQKLNEDSARINKMITAESISYFEYLISSQGKIIIDNDQYENCKNIVEKITNDYDIMNCMGMIENDPFENKEVLLEKEFTFYNPEEYQFGFRAILDNMVIDHNNKLIKINDLKTSSKELGRFTESIEYYKYWLQAGMYHKMIKSYAETMKLEDYKIEFRFIVVDANAQIGKFLISDLTMEEWKEKTNSELKKANYHFQKRDFSLPYEFLISNKEIVL